MTTEASFRMLSNAWPEDYASASKAEFMKAVEGWKIAGQLWTQADATASRLHEETARRMRGIDEFFAGIPLPGNKAMDLDAREREVIAAHKRLAEEYRKRGEKASEYDGTLDRDLIEIMEHCAPSEIEYDELRQARYHPNTERLLAFATGHFRNGSQQIVNPDRFRTR